MNQLLHLKVLCKTFFVKLLKLKHILIGVDDIGYFQIIFVKIEPRTLLVL